MPLTLSPAPMNKAAEANATNANSSVYSIRSWPCSSIMKCFKRVIFVSSSLPIPPALCASGDDEGAAPRGCPPGVPNLAGGRIGVRQLRVGRGPDTLHAVSGADEQSGRSQSNEREQQCVFDQILSLIVS